MMGFGCKNPPSNRGHVLAMLLILMAVISATWLASLGALQRDMVRSKRDFYDLAARTAADSGIELARRELKRMGAARVDEQDALEFRYGGRYFPGLGRVQIECRVQVWIHRDRAFLVSTARVVSQETGTESYVIQAEKRVKQLVEFHGPESETESLWVISD